MDASPVLVHRRVLGLLPRPSGELTRILPGLRTLKFTLDLTLVLREVEMKAHPLEERVHVGVDGRGHGSFIVEL